MTGKKNIKMIMICAAAAILLLGAVFAGLFIRKNRQYALAVNAFVRTDYQKACEQFGKLNNFKESKSMAAMSAIFSELRKGHLRRAATMSDKITHFESSDRELTAAIKAARKVFFDKAKKLYKQNDYDNAELTFLSLDKFQDADKWAILCKADALFHKKDYKKAADQYKNITNFQDADKKASLCQKNIDYRRAIDLFEKGDDKSMDEAGKIFESLGDFENSESYREKCMSAADFKKAKAFYDQGDYESALNILNTVPDSSYDGWDELRTACRNTIDFEKANGLCNAGDIKGALAILAKSPNSTHPGWKDLYKKCRNEITYDEADQLFKSGKYYKAYVKFNALNGYKDAKTRAASCVRDMPKNGEIYHNPSMKSSAVTFVIDNKGYVNTYIMLYTKDKTLVSGVFIRENGNTTIKIPAGTYYMVQAFGEHWFGTGDMFGDDGKYWKCKVGGNDYFTLKSGHKYTMATGQDSGDPVTREPYKP